MSRINAGLFRSMASPGSTRSSESHRAARSAASWTVSGTRDFGLGARSSVATEKLGPKLLLHRPPAALAVELLYLLSVVLNLDRVPAEHVLGSFDQAILPVLHLVGMDIERLGPLSQRVLALHRSQRYLRLKRRGMIASLSPGHLLLLLRRQW